MERLGFAELLAIAAASLAMLVIVAWPASRICRRTGFPGWLGVLAVVPLANLVLLWVVALSPWPSDVPATLR